MENNFIPLESIHIATPCHADWDKMSGDDRTRFCGSCAKNVYNLSAMSRAEAQRLIQEKEGHMCVQLHRREDGTVITSDCPVGISPAKRSAGVVRTLMATAMAALLAVFGVQGVRAASTENVEQIRGDMDVTPARATPTPAPTSTPVPAQTGTLTLSLGKIAMPRPTPTAVPQPPRVSRGEMTIPTPTPAPTKTPAPPRPSSHSL